MRDYKRHLNVEQALCVTIVCDAIIVWNTDYTQHALYQLRADGELIESSDLERMSRLAHQHIHTYGHHPFDLASRPSGYRPLRTIAIADEATAKTPNRV